MSHLEMQFMSQVVAMKLPTPEREYCFAAEHIGRGKDMRRRLQEAGLKNWRFDFAWVAQRLAVEVEGGTWNGGRHTRGAGFREDCIKYHHAMRLGWTVYRCEESLIRSGDAVILIEGLLHAAEGKAAQVLRGADLPNAAGKAGEGVQARAAAVAGFNQEACGVLG